MRNLAAMLALSAMLLSACDSANEDAVGGDALTGANVGAATSPSTSLTTPPSPPSSPRGISDAETTSDASARWPASAVPLTPGVYVMAGTSCENPANAGFRIWTGEGLSGSATRACRATIVSQQGDAYAIANDCENTYDGSRSTERLTMTVPDQAHFAIEGTEFASCPMAQVPDELRRMVDPER